MSGSSGPSQRGTRVEVPGGPGVQAGDHDVQQGKFIGQDAGEQLVQGQPVPVAWPVQLGTCRSGPWPVKAVKTASTCWMRVKPRECKPATATSGMTTFACVVLIADGAGFCGEP